MIWTLHNFKSKTFLYATANYILNPFDIVRFKIQALICPLSFWLFKLFKDFLHEILC